MDCILKIGVILKAHAVDRAPDVFEISFLSRFNDFFLRLLARMSALFQAVSDTGNAQIANTALEQ